jgi:hypothetical protein
VGFVTVIVKTNNEVNKGKEEEEEERSTIDAKFHTITITNPAKINFAESPTAPLYIINKRKVDRFRIYIQLTTQH